jgi:hypothetical protein
LRYCQANYLNRGDLVKGLGIAWNVTYTDS